MPARLPLSSCLPPPAKRPTTSCAKSWRRLASRSSPAAWSPKQFTETSVLRRRGLGASSRPSRSGDVLVVTKLDRLGRNVMDVGNTVAKLAELGCGFIASR